MKAFVEISELFSLRHAFATFKFQLQCKLFSEIYGIQTQTYLLMTSKSFDIIRKSAIVVVAQFHFVLFLQRGAQFSFNFRWINHINLRRVYGAKLNTFNCMD